MGLMALHRKGITGLLGLLLLSSFSFAEDWTSFPIGPFQGLNNRDNSFAIGSNQSQDLLNVDLTPGGKSVRKRKGYGSAFTLSVTTSPVHGVYDFFDANGNEISLFFNDTRMTAAGSGGTLTVLFSTGPVGATYQCTDSLGFAYCVNSNRNTLTKTNGTLSGTSSIISVASTGTMVATAVTRLAMAGFSDAPSRIDFSADTDFNTWGSGSLGSSAVQVTINAPGAKITHITYAFGKLIWFKDTSFGFIIIGNEPLQTDWVVKTVAYDVGTNDNSSVYREGILYFRGKDGYIYAFDGNTYERISREIAGTISTSQSRISGAWVQTTQSDWASGAYFPTTYIDTDTVSGTLQFTFPDSFESLRDGTLSTRNVWTTYCYTGCGTSTVISNGNLVLTSTNSLDQVARTNYPTKSWSPSTTFYIYLTSITSNSTINQSIFTLVISSIGNSSNNPTSLNNEFFFRWVSTIPGTFFFNNIGNSQGDVFSSKVQDGYTLYPATLSVNISASNVVISHNGILIKEFTHTFPSNPMYTYLDYYWGTAASGSMRIDQYGVVPETGTYLSPVNNAPNLSSWDTFTADYQSYAGSQSFYMRSSTNAFTQASSTPAWTVQTSGSIPTISTGTYFQVKQEATLLNYLSLSPKLNSISVNWNEGSATDKSYATYFNDQIWFSVAAGTGATTNNRILLYDMLNKAWLIYDIAANGFYVKQNSLYFGSATSGYIFKFGDSDNDNGSAINSYWKSKDFFGVDPFKSQELANISIVGKTVSNSTMTVTYTLEGSTSTSFSIPLYSQSTLFRRQNRNISSGTTANVFNVKIGNNSADQFWEVFAIQLGLRPKTWNVSQ